MADGAGGACFNAFQIRLPAHRFAGSAYVFQILAVFFAHGNDEIVVVVGYYL
jgi:hypothetical protein